MTPPTNHAQTWTVSFSTHPQSSSSKGMLFQPQISSSFWIVHCIFCKNINKMVRRHDMHWRSWCILTFISLSLPAFSLVCWLTDPPFDDNLCNAKHPKSVGGLEIFKHSGWPQALASQKPQRPMEWMRILGTTLTEKAGFLDKGLSHISIVATNRENASLGPSSLSPSALHLHL